MDTINGVTGEVIGAAIEVHRDLGPGLLESAYQACLAYELGRRGFSIETQKALPIMYRGIRLDAGYRVDMLVEGVVLVELKSVSRLERLHEAQLLSYLRLSGLTAGLLINFNVERLRDGIRRLVNRYAGPRPRQPASGLAASSAMNPPPDTFTFSDRPVERP